MSVLTGQSIRDAILGGELEVSVEIEGVMTRLRSQAAIRHELGLGMAKMDVHLGSEYALYSDASTQLLGSVTHSLKEDQALSLRPGDGLVARSREYLKMPLDLCGIVSSKVGFVTVGLSPVSATLDPGFEGYLIVSLWNLGGLVVNLEYGDSIASLTLLKTDRVSRADLRPRVHKGGLRDIMWSDVLSEYLGKGKPRGQSSSVEEAIEQLRESGSWTGSPFQQIAAALRHIENRLASVEARETAFSEELDNRAFPNRAGPAGPVGGRPSRKSKEPGGHPGGSMNRRKGKPR